MFNSATSKILTHYWHFIKLSLLSGFLNSHGLINIMVLLCIVGTCAATYLAQTFNYGVVCKVNDRTALITTIIISLITIWRVSKQRKLATALLIMQKVQATNAFVTEIPSFIYKSKSTTENTFSGFKIDLSWDHANFILICVILLIIIVYTLTTCKNENRSKICLEVSSSTACVLVDIHCLPMCLTNYHIEVPTSISDLEIIDNCLKPKLIVAWPGFSIKNTITLQMVPINSEIPLTIFQAYKLKKILSKPFFVYLYTFHFGTMTPIRQ